MQCFILPQSDRWCSWTLTCFFVFDFRPKASLLLYFYIFCTCNITDCPTLEIYKYIYKCIKSIYIYEHKADFYFNKVPLHAAVFPLFSHRRKHLQVVWLFMLTTESESPEVCRWLMSCACVNVFWVSQPAFSVGSLCFSLGFTLFTRYILKRLRTCGQLKSSAFEFVLGHEESENSTCTKQ